MATVRDVAKRANTALSTVSRYLNGLPIRKDNRRRIEEAITELGYRPNSTARNLRMSRSFTIGIILPSLSSEFPGGIADGAEAMLSEQGYGSIITVSHANSQRENDRIEYLLSHQVEGLLVWPTGEKAIYQAVLQNAIPMVFLDDSIDEVPVDTVLLDNIRGVYDGVTHLICQGHRRIGLVIGPPENRSALERRLGYERALEDYSMRLDLDLVMVGGWDSAYGAQATEQLLSLPEPPTAIFYANDGLLIGAWGYLQSHGVRIPDELSLCGFYLPHLSELWHPRPTVVTADPMELGRIAGQVLLELVEKKREATFQIHRIPTRLIEGGTVKRL